MQSPKTVSRQITPASWGLPEPFSIRDVVGCLILLGVAVSIWYVGDFHTFHYDDSLFQSLTSLYRWTPLGWESDHIGSFLALLVIFIRRPYGNVLAVSTLSSLLFLGGLTLWASLLASKRTSLLECAVWILLLLPLVVDKHRIFDNASDGSTFGLAFFFAGVFVRGLMIYLQDWHRPRSLFGMFFSGFLTIYLTKTVLIPLGVITLCLIAQRVRTSLEPRTIRSTLALTAPAFCLALALLIYEGLERAAPVANDFRLSLANIPVNLPALLENWVTQELTTPVLIAIPFFALLYKPARPLLVYLAAGIFAETMIVSSSNWVTINQQKGYYLSNLTFLVLLTIVLLIRQFVHQATSPRFHPGLLPIVGAAALLLNAREWNSFSPALPFTAMDRSIGASTPAIVEAGCDLLIGDYWKAWPIMIAVNDYYYRNDIPDPRTGKTRMIVVISYRARPIAALWQPRLDWPDVKPCGLTGDEAEMQSYLMRYAPEKALFLVEPQQFGRITAYQLRNRRLNEIDLNFDTPAPGDGWSYQETTPTSESFTWMTATTANLYLPLAINHSASLEFRVLMDMAPDILRSLTLRVNDQPVDLTAQTEENGAVIFRARLPRSALAANTRATILTFQINRTLIPKLILPGSDDMRALGLAFDWLRIR